VGNRAAKGGAFERWFCKALSLWWSQDLAAPRDDLFWRTSTSGARATVRARRGLATAGHCGDVCATDAAGAPLTRLVTIELKRGYNGSTVADLLDRPPGAAAQTYERWFSQAEAARAAAEAFSWLLIVRRDRREPLAFLPLELAKALAPVGNYRRCRPCMFLDAAASADRDGEGAEVLGLQLASFFSTMRPAAVRALADERFGKPARGRKRA